MVKYQLTIGLNDKNTEKQEIRTNAAKKLISEILLNRFEIFAYTMLECSGVYKMQSSGRIVNEKSIRIEIVTNESDFINIPDIVEYLKKELNQESIMVETFGLTYDCNFL